MTRQTKAEEAAGRRPVQFDSFLKNFQDEEEEARRLTLSAADMEHLFRGGTLEYGEFQVAMQDIGFDHLRAIITQAQQKSVPLLRQVRQV